MSYRLKRRSGPSLKVFHKYCPECGKRNGRFFTRESCKSCGSQLFLYEIKDVFK